MKKLYFLIVCMVLQLPLFGMKQSNSSETKSNVKKYGGLVLVGFGTSMAAASIYGICTNQSEQTIGFVKEFSQYALPTALITGGAYYVIQTNKAIARLNETVKTMQAKLDNKPMQDQQDGQTNKAIAKLSESIKTLQEKLDNNPMQDQQDDSVILERPLDEDLAHVVGLFSRSMYARLEILEHSLKSTDALARSAYATAAVNEHQYSALHEATEKKFKTVDTSITKIEEEQRMIGTMTMLAWTLLKELNQKQELVTQQNGRVEKKVDQLTHLMGTFDYLNKTAEELLRDHEFKQLMAKAL